MPRIDLKAGEEVEISRDGKKSIRIVVPTAASVESDNCCDEGCDLLYYHYVGGVRHAVCDCGTHIQITPCPE